MINPEVLALQIRTLHILFTDLNDQMAQLANAGFPVMTSTKSIELLLHLIHHLDYAGHVSTAAAQSLEAVVSTHLNAPLSSS